MHIGRQGRDSIVAQGVLASQSALVTVSNDGCKQPNPVCRQKCEDASGSSALLVSRTNSSVMNGSNVNRADRGPIVYQCW